LKGASAETHISSYDTAVIYIGLGRKDQALEELENAHQEHSEWLRYIKVDPRLDPVRSDPRFEALLQKVVAPKTQQ